jgi:TonB family protein
LNQTRRAFVFVAGAGALACGVDAEIDQPRPLFAEVPIEYPIHMWDQDMEGETMLRVRVDDTGGVDSVEVVESSGYEAFDSAAVAGAHKLRFEPARRDGKRIEVWAEVPVHFSKRPRPDTLAVSS